MASLALAALLIVARNLFGLPPALEESLSALFTAFALSVVFAMSYKIVPFLVWFHLNAQGYFNAPMMHEVIHPRFAMRHLALHLTALFTALAAAGLTPGLWHVAGALLLLGFGALAGAIYRAWHLYRHVQATQERFDFGGMGG
jgi:uncharacterized membrane protein YesL